MPTSEYDGHTISLGPVTVGEPLPRVDDHVVVDVDAFLGHPVNDFTSTVTYGVFNDRRTFNTNWPPHVDVEAIEERLFDTPLMEDDDADRVRRHANLTNEDRKRHHQAERVIVKSRTKLETPWREVN